MGWTYLNKSSYVSHGTAPQQSSSVDPMMVFRVFFAFLVSWVRPVETARAWSVLGLEAQNSLST